MARLPLFWQLEIPLFHACRHAGSFLFINDVGNMPLGAAAIRTAEIDTIVTDFDDAVAFSAYLAQSTCPIPQKWFIVRPPLRAGKPLPSHLAHVEVAEEVHETPGILRKNL